MIKVARLASLKASIVQLIELVEDLPADYRSSTYSALLSQLIAAPSDSEGRARDVVLASAPEAERSDGFVVNGAVRGFFARTGLNEDQLRAFVIMSGDEIHFAKEPTIVPKSRATVDWAILLALANGLTKGEFSVTRREIRRKADEVGCYDVKNFATTLRESERFFNGAFNDEATKRFLSPAGETRLVNLMRRLT